MIYKIFRQTEWQAFARSGVFTGSLDDMRDGFIHLSSLATLDATFDKYFSQDPLVIIAAFQPEHIGPALVWEASRGGALFPHVYGALEGHQMAYACTLKAGGARPSAAIAAAAPKPSFAGRAYSAFKPLLFKHDAEKAHNLSLKALSTFGALPGGTCTQKNARLYTELAGLKLSSPVGLAAGYAKNGEALSGLSKLGFGMLEIGTVTPRAQAGNDTPRLFRLKDAEAVINRFGFNNKGAAAMSALLAKRLPGGCPVGVNLGANKDSQDRIKDYIDGVVRFTPLADYLTVNISSPNTQGLRDLQSYSALDDLLAGVLAARPEHNQTPIFLKIAPDLSDEDLADIAALALKHPIDALIISNTTISRPDAATARSESAADGTPAQRGPYALGALAQEAGGLSGKPLMGLSTRILADMARTLKGAVPLIGAGGILSSADAYAKILHGASAVQIYSGMVYRGPQLAHTINQTLPHLLDCDGFDHVSDAVGAAL